jgi:hypothetical protein
MTGDVKMPSLQHISTVNDLFSFQDMKWQVFDNEMQTIFLLLTFLGTWETLVVSLSNSAHDKFGGVRRVILREEILWKISRESSSLANIAREKL